MKRLFRTIVTIAAIAGICYGAIAAWRIYSYHFDDLGFDRTAWLKNTGNHDSKNPRGQMAQDLRDRVLRKGMTKEEVSRLLGKPDWWGGTPPPKDVLEYNLGNWAWCPICPDVLDVHLDKTGRLTRVEITEH